MILRRLKAHVEKENWFAVGIDFAIVVIGVFIGIQVANWNEARADREAEARILVRLYADVLAAKTSASRTAESRFQTLEDLLSATDVLFDKVERNAFTQDECNALRASAALGLPYAELSSFEELVSSGRMDIIQDDDLRRALLSLAHNISAADRSLGQILSVRPHMTEQFPEAFDLEPIIFQIEEGERSVGVGGTCDIDWMKTSKAFRDASVRSADAYDAFVRDVVRPWSEGINKVHDRLASILNIDEGSDTP